MKNVYARARTKLAESGQTNVVQKLKTRATRTQENARVPIPRRGLPGVLCGLDGIVAWNVKRHLPQCRWSGDILLVEEIQCHSGFHRTVSRRARYLIALGIVFKERASMLAYTNCLQARSTRVTDCAALMRGLRHAWSMHA